MAGRRLTEAERLRRHNEELKLALAENITVLEARRLLAARRWREFDEKMDRNRRCGTTDSGQGQLQSDYVASPPARPAQDASFWWKDERF